MNIQAIKPVVNLHSQSRGVLLLLLALFSVSIIIFGFLTYDKNSKLQEMRLHGVELARILSEMPYELLIEDETHNGLLAISKYYTGDSRFAYAVITNKDGINQASVTQPGINIPHRNPPVDPSGWLAENVIELNTNNIYVVEFQAPILSNSNLDGFVRIAFYKPSFYLSSSHIPLLSALSLPVFIVVGLFIYFMHREVRILDKYSDVLAKSINSNNTTDIQINASGELAHFIKKFNEIALDAKNKIHDLSNNNRELETSSKLLSYQQAKIQSVLHAMPEGMLVFDESGNINFSNDKMHALFGMDKSKFNHHSLEWCNDDDVKAFLQKIIHNPLSNYINEYVEFSPSSLADKKYIAHAYPLFSPKDRSQIQGTLVLFRDYTEESLAKNARGEFVAHVAHEIKNPLNVLAMYSESLLTEDGESPEFRIEAVNVIQDEVERLSMLINNLLSITKIEMGSMNINRQRVKITDLLDDAFTSIKRAGTNKQLEYILDVPGDISSLYIDKELMRIAINNLLSNAVKYSDDIGTITLSATEDENTVSITITDTGIGIKENEQQFIFDKFYRSDTKEARSRTGHGLGMSLVKDIVNLHHGSIRINSEVGEGTEITIFLENNAALLERAS